MLRIKIPSAELWDEKTGTFIHTKEQTLQLEHSLVSISKWESRISKKDNFYNQNLAELGIL